MSTDRELLELAAKAAGLWENNAGNFSGWECNYPLGWNPLTDDGDALRLAVKLGLTVEVLIKRMEPHTRVFGREEEHRVDPYAATRRAIVRAAAEIGKESK